MERKNKLIEAIVEENKKIKANTVSTRERCTEAVRNTLEMVKKQEEENNKVREEYEIMTKNLEAMKKEIAEKNSSITQLETINTRIYIQNGHLIG